MAASLETFCLNYGKLLVRQVKYAQQRSGKLYRCMSSATHPFEINDTPVKPSLKAKKISQAMKAYLERAQANDQFIAEQVAEFEVGKRHLANMMGVDFETFTQEDIDKAIEYLLPSALHAKNARPLMKHPDVLIPPAKAAQFGVDGRPFHHLFYTGRPQYFQLMHTIGNKVEELKAHEDAMIAAHTVHTPEDKINLAGKQFVTKEKLEGLLHEKITDVQYQRWMRLMERLNEQPYSTKEADFFSKYTISLASSSLANTAATPQVDEEGRTYVDNYGRRKRAYATIKVYEKGTGKIEINGHDILAYFPRLPDREQIMYPLQLSQTMGKVDIFAKVQDGGPSGQAGAIRFALSMALQSFVDDKTKEMMRLGGLLSKDQRRRERKKPGQARARRKFTWKKR